MTRQWKSVMAAIVLLVLSGSSLAVRAQQPPPDNTKVNKRDRQPAQKTADQQNNNKADLETTSEIRKAIIADKSLSTYAHNVKVITVDGRVTLKGPVKTAEEKTAIQKIATDIAGATHVVNQISVEQAGATPASAKPHHKPAKVNP